MRAFYWVTALLTVCCEIVLAAEERAFLGSHDIFRSRFDAQPLNWSATLADKAQAWANGCCFEHSDGQLGPYGENLAAGTGNFTAEDAMSMFMEGLREPSLEGFPCLAPYRCIRDL